MVAMLPRTRETKKNSGNTSKRSESRDEEMGRCAHYIFIHNGIVSYMILGSTFIPHLSRVS